MSSTAKPTGNQARIMHLANRETLRIGEFTDANAEDIHVCVKNRWLTRRGTVYHLTGRGLEQLAGAMDRRPVRHLKLKPQSDHDAGGEHG